MPDYEFACEVERVGAEGASLRERRISAGANELSPLSGVGTVEGTPDHEPAKNSKREHNDYRRRESAATLPPSIGHNTRFAGFALDQSGSARRHPAAGPRPAPAFGNVLRSHLMNVAIVRHASGSGFMCLGLYATR
jgi:hypothetical protein